MMSLVLYIGPLSIPVWFVHALTISRFLKSGFDKPQILTYGFLSALPVCCVLFVKYSTFFNFKLLFFFFLFAPLALL